MDDDDIDQRIEDIASDYDTDPETVRKKYEEKLEQIESKDVIGIGKDELKDVALQTTVANLQSGSRTGPAGEVEEVPILAIGNYGVFDTWGQDNDTVLVGVGIVAPEDKSDENRPPGVGVFILKESVGLDIGRARQEWLWGEHIRGWFTVDKMAESFTTRDRTYYILESTDESKFEGADFSGDLPGSPADVRDLLANNFVKESFTLATVADNLSVSGEDFGSNWADLRRIKGQVVDAYRRLPEECEPGENPFGKLVLVDSTVGNMDDLEENRDLVTEDELENGRQPGLQVYLPPEAVQYGEDSTLEVYGTLTRNEETGQITMDGAGVAPLVPYPYDDGDEGGSSDDTEVESL